MRILKDSFIYLIGELFAKSLPFLMLPYLTRKLGPDGFGELSYYLTMLSLFGIFVGLSQDGAVTRYFYFYGKKALNTVVKAGYLFNIAISILLLLSCWWFKAEIMAYVVLATMFQSFVNVQLALRQCQKQPLKYITIQVILSLTNVLFTVAALEYLSQDLVAYRILAIVIANMTTFLIASLVLGDLFRDDYRFTWQRLRLGLFYIFSFGLPLILHQSSFFIKGQLDRIFIYQQYSKVELGIYSAGVQIAAVLPIVLMALNKAIVPYYYQGLKDNSLSISKIKKYTLFSLPLSILPAVVGWLLPEQVYLWFLGPSYIGSKYYVVMYLIGFGANLPYLILVNYFFFYAKNKTISTISLISSLIYLLSLWILCSIDVSLIPFSLILSNLVLLCSLWWSIKYVR
ncbi:oligosaccharide flippase family protein [Acinetobacter baumannii]|uniref:oligosaccharide flippase family protein n=1 Tax=Acinetobacter baumannii TaxID=470 RepID=UPI00044E2B02|nr:oligosaccharide flippase family protein [Acinetobacter baumannii]EXR79828.1 polysaccharide biosynthesis family protein [Acinetobacter baumannii 541915]MDC4254898.1 oligosaccharide flippase family protein [Acinetobacter baumannii]MDC4470220.1 oligosaccharide flippase family protein [Acinetobacter baumannii]MDC5005354.1 oligosaccharide flippase family protein [Acinetobacter baumannii]MDC5593527.1 oligosaccharide flippase family protein [Acinetobacter baumannii]